jgi:hypothetical protein
MTEIEEANAKLDRLRRENDELWKHISYLEACLDEARGFLGMPPATMRPAGLDEGTHESRAGASRRRVRRRARF